MAKSQIKSGAVFSYLSIFTNIIVGLLIAPVMLKFLGDTECSLYNLIGALVGYISVLDFGISNAIIRYVAKYRLENKEQEQRRFLGMAFLLYTIFAILVIGVGLAISPFLPNALANSAYTEADIQKALLMFMILIVNLAFSLLSNAFPAIMNGYGRFSFQKIVTWLRTILRIILLILLLAMGYDSVAIVILDTVLNVVTALIFAAYVFIGLKVKVSFHGMNFAMMREITHYSFYIFLDMLINQIYWKLGQLVLGVVSAPPIEINAFAYGMTIPNYYIMISTALATMFLPTITKIVTEQEAGKKLTDLMIRVGRIQLLILGLVLVGFHFGMAGRALYGSLLCRQLRFAGNHDPLFSKYRNCYSAGQKQNAVPSAQLSRRLCGKYSAEFHFIPVLWRDRRGFRDCSVSDYR